MLGYETLGIKKVVDQYIGQYAQKVVGSIARAATLILITYIAAKAKAIPWLAPILDPLALALKHNIDAIALSVATSAGLLIPVVASIKEKADNKKDKKAIVDVTNESSK